MEPVTLEMCNVQILMVYHLMDDSMHGNYLLVNVRICTSVSTNALLTCIAGTKYIS